MANNEFENIDQFIEGFTRIGKTPKIFSYDGVIYGIDFKYRNKIYRISRDTTGDEEKLRIKFHKNEKAYIHFYELNENKYPNETVDYLDQYIGFFESVNELLDFCFIDGTSLRNIIVSDETIILSID